MADFDVLTVSATQLAAVQKALSDDLACLARVINDNRALWDTDAPVSDAFRRANDAHILGGTVIASRITKTATLLVQSNPAYPIINVLEMADDTSRGMREYWIAVYVATSALIGQLRAIGEVRRA